MRLINSKALSQQMVDYYKKTQYLNDKKKDILWDGVDNNAYIQRCFRYNQKIDLCRARKPQIYAVESGCCIDIKYWRIYHQRKIFQWSRIYNIQHINNSHSQLKRFMRGFNGVSTKYLNNYLVWNNLVNYAKETATEKRNIFLTFVLVTLKSDKCRYQTDQQFRWLYKFEFVEATKWIG